MRRFYSATPIAESLVVLDDDEAHHLLHVLRAKAGDEVILFDGSGWEFPARVTRCGKKQIELEIVARAEVDRELPQPVTLGIALPKGDRQKWLVEKAVEMGAAKLVPLETERGVAQPQPQVLDRLRRAVIEASKQCGRNRLMEIAEPQAWSEWQRQVPAEALRLVAHPTEVGDAASRAEAIRTARAGIYLAIGPEGGFSNEEVSGALALHWQPLQLGRRILRIETAALAVLAQSGAALEG